MFVVMDDENFQRALLYLSSNLFDGNNRRLCLGLVFFGQGFVYDVLY